MRSTPELIALVRLCGAVCDFWAEPQNVLDLWVGVSGLLAQPILAYKLFFVGCWFVFLFEGGG